MKLHIRFFHFITLLAIYQIKSDLINYVTSDIYELVQSIYEPIAQNTNKTYTPSSSGLYQFRVKCKEVQYSHGFISVGNNPSGALSGAIGYVAPTANDNSVHEWTLPLKAGITYHLNAYNADVELFRIS